MDRWNDVTAVLRIALSNKKCHPLITGNTINWSFLVDPLTLSNKNTITY
jgi:hypothetical protein